MTTVDADHSGGRRGLFPCYGPAAAMAGLALALSLHQPVAVLLNSFGGAGVDPLLFKLERINLLFSFAPRLVVTIVTGAALGLGGTLLQQSLRNPLADPTTVGAAAGAQLAIAIATLFLPDLASAYREEIAFVGTMAATLVVMSVAWRHRMSALSLLLTGQLVNLVCGAIGAFLALLHHERLQSVFIWTTGPMDQYDWGTAIYLLPRVAAVGGAAFCLARPLSVLSLGEQSGKGVGLAVWKTQALALCLAMALSAFVVGSVGIVSLVGLAAPALVRLSGARSFRDQLLWAPPTGAAILWLTDQTVQALNHLLPRLTTGTTTALLGALLLLIMVPRSSGASFTLGPALGLGAPRSRARPIFLLTMGGLLLLVVVGAALFVGPTPQGWLSAMLLPWRWPRVVGSAIAGAALGSAGCIVQRVTGNPIAGPESLGISAGAAFGAITALFFAPPAVSAAILIPSAALGGAMVFAFTLLLGRRTDFSPEKVLLIGVAATGALSASIPIFLASGDPRLANLITWMSGSTYRVTGNQAALSAAIVAPCVAGALFLLRWLEVLPLGPSIGQALGISPSRSRLALLSLASLLTAVATLMIGPLSFIGVMAPQTAALLGLRRAYAHLVGATLMGALFASSGDWLGRTILFPYQVPAGLAATFMGAPCFVWLLQRRYRVP